MHNWRVYLVNALCLSRIPLGAAFILVYSPSDGTRFGIAIGIAVIALLTDTLDGYLARHFGLASDAGAILDGLGDKAFYIAVYMVIAEQDGAQPLLLWLLIIREVLLYGLRVIDRNRQENTKKLRLISLAFAAVIRFYFLAFVVQDLLFLIDIQVPSMLRYKDALAYLAVALGYYGLIMMCTAQSKESGS